MKCFTRFGTICTIQTTWITPMKECHKSNTLPWVSHMKICYQWSMDDYIASPEYENIFDISFASRFLMISARISKYLSMSMGYFLAITRSIRTWWPKPWSWFISVCVFCVNDIFSYTSGQIFLIRAVKLPQKPQKIIIIHAKFFFLTIASPEGVGVNWHLPKSYPICYFECNQPTVLKVTLFNTSVLTGEHERWKVTEKMMFTNALCRWLPTLLANFVDKSDISIFFFGITTLLVFVYPFGGVGT